MWYMPYLRVRHAVVVYTYIALGITLVSVALRFWPGVVHLDPSAVRAHAFIDIGMLTAAAAALVGGFATVLGLNLAAENDGHLEVAWTKPVSREGYALGVFAVDLVAMAACIALTTVCMAIIVDTYAGSQIISLGSADGAARHLAFCGFPLCVYGWISALSASLKRNRGAVAGVFWPAMFLLAVIPNVPYAPFAATAPIFKALDLLNPVDLFTASSSPALPGAAWSMAWGWLVGAALLAAALAQWRRLQL